jgi:hypothetical protein
MEIHIFLGLMIPAAFFAFAGLIKSLVKASWTWGNFYLGIDIALAAMANGIVNVVDLVHQAEGHAFTQEFAAELTNTVICIVVAFAALLLTMGLHQKFDVPGQSENGNRRIARGILLGVVGNLAGVCVLGLFIYWKLRRLV